MKKIILSSIMVMALLLSVTSCKEKKKAESTEDAVESTLHTEIATDSLSNVEETIDETATDSTETDVKAVEDNKVEEADDEMKKYN